MTEVAWSDGAQMGVGPKQAMHAAIGGAARPSDTDEETTLTKEQMYDKIKNIQLDPEGNYANYDDAAWAMAHVVLTAYLSYPQLQSLPTEPVFLRDDNGIVWPHGKEGTDLIYLTPELYGVIKKIYGDTSPERNTLAVGSGFQWGWAVNAARRCLDLPEAPNPALLVRSASE